MELWNTLPDTVKMEIVHQTNHLITTKYSQVLSIIITQIQNGNAQSQKEVGYTLAGAASGAFLASLIFSNPIGIGIFATVSAGLAYNKARTGKNLTEYIATYSLPDTTVKEELELVILPNLPASEKEELSRTKKLTEGMLDSVLKQMPDLLENFYDSYCKDIIQHQLSNYGNNNNSNTNNTTTNNNNLSIISKNDLGLVKTCAKFSNEIYDKSGGLLKQEVFVMNKTVFIVFRGTKNAVDVLVDAATFEMVHPSHKTLSVHGGIGSTHKKSVGKTAKAELLKILSSAEGSNCTDIICCGHSLGGAYAFLLVIDLLTKKMEKKEKWKDLLANKNIRAVTFGAPLVVKRTKTSESEMLPVLKPGTHLAIVHQLDVIPRLLYFEGNVLDTLQLLNVPGLPQQKDVGSFEPIGDYFCLSQMGLTSVPLNNHRSDFFRVPPGVVTLVGSLKDHLMAKYISKLDSL